MTMNTNVWMTIVVGALVACGGSQAKPLEPSAEGESATADAGGESSAADDDAAAPVAPVAAPPTVPGHYDKESTEIVLKRSARQVKDNCGAAKDETGKATGPWGKLTIQVALGRNGHSKGVTVPAPYDGKAPGKCIMQAFSNLQYPPWAGTDTSIDWEVELVKPAGVK